MWIQMTSGIFESMHKAWACGKICLKTVLDTKSRFAYNMETYCRNDTTQMLKLLHELTKTVNIGSFSCEHPAFYDGLLSMLKNQEGN